MPRTKRGIKEDMRIFWSQVDKSGGSTACWLWVGKVDTKGYGYTQYDGKPHRTHRLSYSLHNRPISEGKDILHTCDTPCCVQPLHLWPGTQADNVADMDAKGRRGTIKGQRVGEKNPLAKLTDAQVAEIRQRYLAESVMQKDLAREYGVVNSAISHIIRGKRFGGPDIRRSAKENALAISGERHHEGKLTADAVKLIRIRYAAGDMKLHNLATEYRVTKQMIWRIVHRKVWLHVE